MSAAEEDAYFSSNPPPRNLARHVALTSDFIAHHQAAAPARPVVLITSGGTTVPLEKNTVRFIDNFSAGTRGATSAEYFLAAGYAVIFLHREFSLKPFSRHYSHARDSVLDFLDVDDEGRVFVPEATAGQQQQQQQHDGGGLKMVEVLKRYKEVKRENLLLMLPFVTIGDYLHELRAIARLMAPLGPRGLLYLAAAVSDFFVPPERMAEHKIQSTDAVKNVISQQQQQAAHAPPEGASGGNEADGNVEEEEEETFDNFDASPSVPRSKRLVIDLDPVPKFLQTLVDGWAPHGMIVSYKLETDPAILVHKARYSLDRYQHHLVIGNLLSTRKWEVVFVSPGRDDMWLRVGRDGGWGEAEGRPLREGELPHEEPSEEIEGLIIPAVKALHEQHVARERSDKTASRTYDAQ